MNKLPRLYAACDLGRIKRENMKPRPHVLVRDDRGGFIDKLGHIPSSAISYEIVANNDPRFVRWYALSGRTHHLVVGWNEARQRIIFFLLWQPSRR